LENRDLIKTLFPFGQSYLKLGGCFATHLRTLLNQSSPPSDQNFALFKIQLNFGQIHQILFFSYSFSLPPLQINQVTQILASHRIPLPLHYGNIITAPLSFLGWKIWEARGVHFLSSPSPRCQEEDHEEEQGSATARP
jgi:hypothetical protein